MKRDAQTFVIRPEDAGQDWRVFKNCTATIRERVILLSGLGHALEVTIGLYQKQRSKAQNRCFHGWMTAIANWHREATGSVMDQTAWKLWFKRSLIGYQTIDLPDGTQETQLRSTADLSVAEFVDVLRQIEVFESEQDGLELPRNHDYLVAMGIEKDADAIALCASRSGGGA